MNGTNVDPSNASLRDVFLLICGLEERLTARFDQLQNKLQERPKVNTNAPPKRTVNFDTRPRDMARGGLLSDVSVPATSVQSPGESDSQKDVFPPSTSILNLPKRELPVPASTRSPRQPPNTSTEQSVSLWQKYGKKPSEAAKSFLHDALTKAQKVALIKSRRIRDESSSKSKGSSPLPGLTRMIDLRGEEGHTTATMRGWWNPKDEDCNWFVSARKRADQVRNSVFDLLLTKGWIRPEQKPLSNARAETISLSMSLLTRLVYSAKFEAWCACLIMLNAILLGIQTQYKADPDNDGESALWQEILQAIFTCWFFLEVVFRISVLRLNFFISNNWKWNVFDLIVVTISAVELCLQLADNEDTATNLNVARIIRILRWVRAIRFIRLVRFLAELRMMLYGSLKCMKPFMWAMIILYIIIYMFAIITTQIVSDYRREHPEKDLDMLLKYFGSLGWSVYTLFLVISGGVSWMEPTDELLIVHWSFAIWMSLYVAFVMLAILNIVTGIFIESALKSAQEDQDVVIQEEMNHEDSLAQGFLEVFHELDRDQSGYIDMEEFDQHVHDHRVRAFLHHLGIDIHEAHGLFRLLDIGGTGRVYAKEFVLGCQQLRGPAKNVDVATLLFQNKRMMQLWAVFMSFVEDQFALLLVPDGRPDSVSTLHISRTHVKPPTRSYATQSDATQNTEEVSVAPDVVVEI